MIRKNTVVRLSENAPPTFNDFLGIDGIVLSVFSTKNGQELCVIKIQEEYWVIAQQYLVKMNKNEEITEAKKTRLNFVVDSSFFHSQTNAATESLSENRKIQIRLFKRASRPEDACDCVLRLEKLVGGFGTIVEMYVEQYWKDTSLFVCGVTINTKSSPAFTEILAKLSHNWNLVNKESAVWEPSVGDFVFTDITFANVEMI